MKHIEICKYCGRVFKPQHQNQRYCSSACRDFAYLKARRKTTQRKPTKVDLAEEICRLLGVEDEYEPKLNMQLQYLSLEVLHFLILKLKNLRKQYTLDAFLEVEK